MMIGGKNIQDFSKTCKIVTKYKTIDFKEQIKQLGEKVFKLRTPDPLVGSQSFV